VREDFRQQPTEGEKERALLKSLPQRFISPPLLPGLLACVNDALGPNARPFPIQRLSLHHFFPSLDSHVLNVPRSETLLASETGSGKSFAYLLPVLQALKQSEIPQDSSSRMNIRKPRALIIAPTHELCRQLASQSKSLSHEIKLRTICLSNPSRRASSVKTLRDFPETISELQPFGKMDRQPDTMIGTPSKIAHLAALIVETDQESPAAASRPKGINFTRPEISFEAVEWVVIDEADVLFGVSWTDSLFSQVGIYDSLRMQIGITAKL
jgi:ATP-dependent RNA helicase MRH4, mitochondrial